MSDQNDTPADAFEAWFAWHWNRTTYLISNNCKAQTCAGAAIKHAARAAWDASRAAAAPDPMLLDDAMSLIGEMEWGGTLTEDGADYLCCPQCGYLHPKSVHPFGPYGHAHYCPVLAIQARYAAFKASETKP